MLLELLLLLLLLLHPPHRNIEVLHNNTINRLQAQQLYVLTETCHRLGRKPHPLFKLLSVREEENRRRRWRNNAGRAGRSCCAFPIDGAKAAIQQQELDSELVVGSLHPSASASKCRGAPFFAPFSRVFSKRTNRAVF